MAGRLTGTWNVGCAGYDDYLPTGRCPQKTQFFLSTRLAATRQLVNVISAGTLFC
jgi:hypothetical protein